MSSEVGRSHTPRALGRMVLIGSGEIGPSMAPLHRAIVAALPKRSLPASLVALDGSYDFQENRAEMGEKIALYFRSKIGIPTTVVGLPEPERDGADLPPNAFAPTLAALNAANLLFLGPGSPSRAIARWGGTPIVARLESRVRDGATLVTSSAGAAAVGAKTLPVYELYKAGTNASWLDGLDLFGALTNVRVAIVPHWNNAEGGTHDTSRCYIGETRLARLQRELPDGVSILGIDEHTALSLDFGADRASVHGKGAVTIRIPGIGETALHAGAVESIETFTTRLSPTLLPLESRLSEAAASPASAPTPPTATAHTAERSAARLPTDEPSSDGRRGALAPAVERLLALRAAARAEGRFADADAIRSALEALGVEVKDGSEGATWSLRP